MYIIVSYDQVKELACTEHAGRTKDGRVILPLSVMKASKSLTGVDFVTLETALSMMHETPVVSEDQLPESSDVVDSTTSESVTENQESINPKNPDSNE